MATPLPMVEAYPRPITEIHQLEVSSQCNLRCHYCTSRHLDKPYEEGGYGRAKEHMSLETFERALVWAKHFNEQGTQGELALTGIGEPLMHPHFADLVRLSREALPTNLITFSTNGILLNDAICEQIAPYNPRIYISLHRPEKAKHAVDVARRWGLLDATNVAFATEAHSWAGALDEWENTASEITCEFLRSGWSVVLADGRITTCCLDSAGGGVVGTIWDEPGSLSISPWHHEETHTGCDGCYQRVPEGIEVRQR